LTDYPITTAVRQLRKDKISFTAHLYEYVEHGGTAVSSKALGVPEEQVVKTLIFEDERQRPLVILMQGHLQVSAKELARQIGCKSVAPCRPEVAERHTGYRVGGTSPFGLKKALPIYAEKSIAELPCIYINGGARGFLVGLLPADLERSLQVHWVEVARP
jgi:Cys-tRNA(Pro) deacylase